MGRILVCGNLNIDRILTVDYLPAEGQSTPVRSQRIEYGGCGGNIAAALAKLGTGVILSTVVGRDLDPDYEGRLKELGVDLSGMVVDEELPSPSCTVLTAPGGKQTYAFMMGAMEKQGSIDIPVFEDVSFVHIATSDPDFTIRTAKHYAGMRIEVGMDPGQEIYFRWERSKMTEVLKYCTRFFGNLDEWKHLLRICGWKGMERKIAGMEVEVPSEPFDHLKEAVITMGERGSILITQGETLYQGPVETGPVIDPTGAGDAFRGGFYSALIRGLSSYDSLLYGNAMGALSLTGKGPQGYDTDWEALLKVIQSLR
ncbi:MAG: carbohydrate kinase family protein [Thermoplasmatota archaeon]